MKKIIRLSWLLIALLIALLACYFTMGLITEHTLKKNLSIINQSNGLVVTISKYKRGWFTAHTTINWTLTIPARIINEKGRRIPVPEKTYAIAMPLAIYHGPIMKTPEGVFFGLGYATTDLNLPDNYKAEFAKLYTHDSQQPHLRLNVLVNFMNKMRANLEIPAFHLFSIQGHHQFDWLGLKSNISISAKNNNISGNLILTGLHIVKDQVQALIGAIQTEYKLHQTANGLYTGTAHFTLPSALITDKGEKKLVIEKFNLTSNSNVTHKLFYSNLIINLEHLFLNNQEYGPGNLTIAIKNLDADTLAQINSNIKTMQNANDSDKQQNLFKLIAQLPVLLNKGAAINITNMQLNTPQGDINGHLSLLFPNKHITNPFQLFQQATGELTLNASAPILRAIIQNILQSPLASMFTSQTSTANNATTELSPTMIATETDTKIATMLKSKVLVLQNDHYVFNVKWLNGHLTINNQAFNTNMMIL